MLRAHRITGVAAYVTGRARPGLSSQHPHLRRLPTKEVPSTTNLDCAHPRPRFPKPATGGRMAKAWHRGATSRGFVAIHLGRMAGHTWGAPLRCWTNHSITPLEPRSELKAGRRWTHARTHTQLIENKCESERPFHCGGSQDQSGFARLETAKKRQFRGQHLFIRHCGKHCDVDTFRCLATLRAAVERRGEPQGRPLLEKCF